MTSLYLFSREGTTDHHREYNAVLQKEFGALGSAPIFVDRMSLRLVGQNVFFAMIEAELWPFVLCALAGVFSGRRTVGLLFRPRECFRRDRLKYSIKYALFRFLRRMTAVRVLTILPFSVDPKFAQIAHDWVYDPQLWDLQILDDLPANASTPLSREAVDRAGGRAMIVALGGQNRRKGFDYLCELWLGSPELRARYLVVAAGKVGPESQTLADRLREAGGLVFDRFVSAEELAGLYAVSQLVWGAYHPNYDQASGIVGRAFQLGVPAIVREGSYIAGVLRDLKHVSIEISYDDQSEALRRLLAPGLALERLSPPIEMAAAMRSSFVSKIADSFALKASGATRVSAAELEEGASSRPPDLDVSRSRRQRDPRNARE